MNSSFSSQLPTLQIAWDSTSLSALKECPRRYQYSIVLGYAPRVENVHLTFGILYHEALEAYDRARTDGMDHNEGTRHALKKALQGSWNFELSRPWSSGDSYKNRYTLARTIVWYLDQFENDPVSTVQLANGKPAVELSFRFQFPYTFQTGEEALMCGHMDRLGMIGNMAWILDRKTTKHGLDQHYFSQYTPDNQMSLYSVAGRIVYNVPVQGVIIDGAQVLVSGSRFARGFANRTEDQLHEWMTEARVWIAQAEGYAITNLWPMNERSCYGCAYREVCSQPPKMRQKMLDTMFSKRTWDPLKVRGDV